MSPTFLLSLLLHSFIHETEIRKRELQLSCSYIAPNVGLHQFPGNTQVFIFWKLVPSSGSVEVVEHLEIRAAESDEVIGGAVPRRN